MQGELDAEGTALPIRLLGVNQSGLGPTSITDGRDIPWLQDDSATDFYGAFNNAGKYDFYIVDGTGQAVAYWDLGSNSLTNSQNREDIKAEMIAIANGN